MGKKVLAVFYTQTGQLADILDHFTAPLETAGHSVEKVQVYPAVPYPFPWTGTTFFSVMPHCVNQVPTTLQPFSFKEQHYDLIILGYSAWFLSPSIPANSIMMSPEFARLAKNTPVVTITGGRNMWISAMEKIKPTLRNTGARLVGNVALVDRHHNFVSFITIFHWMFKGRKDRYLNIFPKPGVSDADIAGSALFGKTVSDHLGKGNWETLQDDLVAQGAVRVKYPLMFIESKARKIFRIWAGIISKKQNQKPWLVAFKYYLLIALFIAAPIILTVDFLFFKPFLSGRIKRQKHYYSGVN